MNNITICKNKEELADCIASTVADSIRTKPDSLICFAAGETPLPMLKRLVEMQKENIVNLKDAYYVSLDEWWGIGYETPGSCVQVMKDTFYTPAGISESHMALFDGTSDSAESEMNRVSSFVERLNGLDPDRPWRRDERPHRFYRAGCSQRKFMRVDPSVGDNKTNQFEILWLYDATTIWYYTGPQNYDASKKDRRHGGRCQKKRDYGSGSEWTDQRGLPRVAPPDE